MYGCSCAVCCKCETDGRLEDADEMHVCRARQSASILPTSLKTAAFDDLKDATTCA